MDYQGSRLIIQNNGVVNNLVEIYDDKANPMAVLKLSETSNNEYYNELKTQVCFFKYFCEYNFIKIRESVEFFEKESTFSEDYIENIKKSSPIIFSGTKIIINDEEYYYKDVTIKFPLDNFEIIDASSLFLEDTCYEKIKISHVFIYDEDYINKKNNNSEEEDGYGKEIFYSNNVIITDEDKNYKIYGANFTEEENKIYDNMGIQMKPNIPYLLEEDKKDCCILSFNKDDCLLSLYFPFVDKDFENQIYLTDFSNKILEFKFKNDVFFSEDINNYTVCCNYLCEELEEIKEEE